VVVLLELGVEVGPLPGVLLVTGDRLLVDEDGNAVDDRMAVPGSTDRELAERELRTALRAAQDCLQPLDWSTLAACGCRYG
jgi:hypothetical protein